LIKGIFYRDTVIMQHDKNLLNQMVTVKSLSGDIDRLVVEDHGDVVAVCRPEEAESARNEGRRPRLAPFKKADIVRVF
jgi:hypothetical protein